MASPIDRFRFDLTRTVRRLSRSKSNETTIDEMVSHFDGLYQEEKQSEPNEQVAEKKARQRMGSVYKIAIQIVSNPDRTKKGLRLQSAIFGFLAVLIPFILCSMDAFNPWFAHFQRELLNSLMFMVFGLPVVAGLGIAIAKKLAWKSLVLTACVAFLGTGLLVDSTLPEIQMTKTQMSELVARQNILGPKVARIESQVKKILTPKSQSAETWKSELKPLPGLVKDNDVPFYKEEPNSSGAYLYPAKINYTPLDFTVNYSVQLNRTNDLWIAQNAWTRESQRNAFLGADIANRERNFQFWREAAANQSTLWMRGFEFSGLYCLRMWLIFSAMALLGYLLGRVRVYGFDWLRGVRA